jgi:hypothetical protein
MNPRSTCPPKFAVYCLRSGGDELADFVEDLIASGLDPREDADEIVDLVRRFGPGGRQAISALNRSYRTASAELIADAEAFLASRSDG